MPVRSRFVAFELTRIVARPEEIARCTFENSNLVARLANDEALLARGTSAPAWFDDHAIVEPDTSFSAAEFDDEYLRQLLAPRMEWQWDGATVGQGVLFQVPVKLVRYEDRNLLLCPTPFAHELEDRLP